MLEQETPSEVISKEENMIDADEKLYLMTYSPNPIDMPDADFKIQHDWNVNLLSEYLEYCACGLFCVESSQMGNPHYHGWYQVCDCNELYRIQKIKVLQRFGMVKITKARSYKINKYYPKGNALYYYKKDLLDAMIDVQPNPITSNTRIQRNYDDEVFRSFLSCQRKEVISTYAKKQADYKYYEEFYKIKS